MPTGTGLLFKGVPAQASDLPLSGLVALDLRLADDALALPAALLRTAVMERNAAWMASFAASAGLDLAPHGKTTMSPELFELQLRHGAWAVTAATAHHARLYAEFGIRRVLIANQIAGAANLTIVAELLARDEALDLYCLVDSVAGVEALDGALRKAGTRAIRVLLESGDDGQRAGVRTPDAARAVAAACRASEHVRLVGVECFEGVHATDADAAAMLGRFVKIAEEVGRSGVADGDEFVVSAGGSLFFDEAARAMLRASAGRTARLVLRSGCYLTHDHGMYARALEDMAARGATLPPGGLEPALEVWAHVQSRPEPGRIIASLGKRDVSYDVEPPRPILRLRPGRDSSFQPIGEDVSVAKLYDQHACIDVPDDCDLAVGDLIGFGVSHPCTTFDKWRAMFLVDEDRRVTGAVRTFF